MPDPPSGTLLPSGALGALVAMALVVASRSSVSFVAGLVALFRAFGLVTHVFSFHHGGAEQVRTVALFDLLSLLPYAAYLLTIIAMRVERFGLSRGLAVALLAWATFAAVSVLVWQTHLMQGLAQRS